MINNIISRPGIPELLISEGYQVDAVRDADAGLWQLDNRLYDIVIVLESPIVESWQLCARIRNRAGLPLIVISPRASTETCVRAIDAGADYFMRKPFGPLEFLARVKSLLQHTPVRQSAAASR